MKTAAIFTLASALVASAMPAGLDVFRRQSAAGSPTDVQILQYALTLENLEATFYKDALAKYDQAAFAAAGYPDWVRNRFSQIAAHEASHVAALSGALGNQSVAACTYKFPYTDVTSFIGLAAAIENVGVSAYAGAAQYIKDPAYLTIAAVILSTEARHQAWQESAVLKNSAWSSAYDTALGLNMVYTIASQFITACPASNPALPVKAYGTLAVGAGNAAGTSAKFTFDNSKQGSTVEYAIFYNGLGSQAVQLSVDHTATVPAGLQGYSYVLISTASSAKAVTADNIVAGPAILNYPFVSSASNPGFTGA